MMSFQTYKCRHGLLSHYDSDNTIGSSLRLYGEWAEQEIFLFSKYVQPGATFIDVGSNIGSHTVAVSKIIGDAGIVYSLEAQHAIFQILGMNILLNNAKNIIALHGLVGSDLHSEYIPYENKYDNQNYGAKSYVKHKPERQENTVPILGISIDSLNLKKCDFIKIDVEGMELDVILGAIKTINQSRPYVYFEQNSSRNLENIFLCLREKGYRLYWHVSNPFNANNFNNYSVNIFGGTCCVNIFAVPDSRKLYNDPIFRLIEIDNPIYDPIMLENSIKGWELPFNAYNNLGYTPL